MSPAAILVLAFGMSADAFAASLGRGAAGRARWPEVLRTGAVFGLIEAITPVIGWGAGVAASAHVQAVDHWIAFGLLGAVGGRMLFEAARRPAELPRAARSPWMLVATACGTSIDAMAVGVSLAFLDVNIWVVAAAIGAATFCMATGGMLAGRVLGQRLGRLAEAAAGMALILLGGSILHAHLAG